MFDYEKLTVYQKAKSFYHNACEFLNSTSTLDRSVKDQFKRASLSIVLNIAEGSSRFSKADRKNFFVIARGSAFECAAIIDLLEGEFGQQNDFVSESKGTLEELSKMLFVMIRNLN